MSTPRAEFDHSGMSWSDVLDKGELDAVLYRRGSERVNLLMHAQTLFGAKVALARSGLNQRTGVVLDFGCGTGRIVRFFGSKGLKVIGVDVTPEMLVAARRFGLPPKSALAQVDGVSIPLGNESVDLIWVCGVLKYSLFKPGSPCRVAGGVLPDAAAIEAFIPVYADIAREMYRVLKPGGIVANVEMWVNSEPAVFTRDFEEAQFVTKRVAVLRRYRGWMERALELRSYYKLPAWLVTLAGHICARLRYRFDRPERPAPDYRDYLFVWSKPQRQRHGDAK
jgi:SAM-dependent methyltransferase